MTRQLENYQSYLNFINDYAESSNAATGSKFDSNANVEQKNVTTATGELFKADAIGINRLRMHQKIEKMYGRELADEYIRQLESHELYRHDETNPLLVYCCSITMYPFLFNGLKQLGGGSGAPHNLDSFAGSFINLCFAISAQFAGAVSTPEFLSYMDYFIRKEYGDDYYLHADDVVDLSTRHRSIDKIICDKFEQVVYSLNQPAAARNFQCVRENTQLCTPNGFKHLKDLHEGDECYVWKDGKITIEKIKHLNVYDYDGEMICFKGNHYQQTVTPNHRVVYKKTDGSNEYTIREAQELFNHSKLSLPICGTNNFDDYPISDELLKVCTYTLTDGSIAGKDTDAHSSHSIHYYMSPNRGGLSDLKECLAKLGIEYTETVSTVNAFGTVNIINLNPFNSAVIANALENTKKKLPAFFTQLSQRQARLVLDCWSKTDGQKLRSMELNTRLLLQCDNMQIADAVQQICLLAGVGSTITRRKTGSFDGEANETIYVQTFSGDCKRITSYEKVSYKGRVWCPSTDAGVVIFREENNTPYISGNSIFWNIAYFDEPYFKGMFENFVFPDGTSMKWESVSWLQKRFMKWFNAERTKRILTFPVETVNLLDDGKEYVDQEWADFTAEMLGEGHSFFVYRSDSVDSLASCCYTPDTLVYIKLNDESVDEKFAIHRVNFYEIEYEGLKDGDYSIWNNGEWSTGKFVKLPNRQIYKVITKSGRSMKVTDNHRNFTREGMKLTDELSVGDSLLVVSTPDEPRDSFWDEIISIEPVDYDGAVYCFEMDNAYDDKFTLANGIHNYNCRLRNEVQDNTFSYTLGAGGVSTGSKGVITINMNRLIQNCKRENKDIRETLREQVRKIHKYLLAWNEILKDEFNARLLPVYDAGFISLEKQYLTIGINGMVEGCEYLGYDISADDPEYIGFVESLLSVIYEENKTARTKEVMFNTEFVPKLSGHLAA